MYFLSTWVGEQFWETVVSHTLSSHGWFQRQVFTAAWNKVRTCYLQLLFFSWSIRIWSAYIWLLLSFQSHSCYQSAGFVLGCPCLTHRASPPPTQSWQATTFLPFALAEGSWRVCSYSQVILLSSAISVSYMDTISSSEPTALRSIGTKIASLFHSSICWTQQTTCNCLL